MRIRTIKPEFFHHEGIFDAERESNLPLRLAFIGLWCAADREGRFKWEPRRLGVQILPYDQIDFSRVLDALATRGFVIKYTSETGDFGLIPSFRRHQIINNKERGSELPEPLLNMTLDACPTRESRDSDVCRKEGKGKEGKGNIHNPPAGDDADEGFSPESDEPSPAETKSKARASSAEEAEEFAAGIGCLPGQGEAFFWKMAGNGWTNNGRPVKDWKATVRSWKLQGYLPVPDPSQVTRSAPPPETAEREDDGIPEWERTMRTNGQSEQAIERQRSFRAKHVPAA